MSKEYYLLKPQTGFNLLKKKILSIVEDVSGGKEYDERMIKDSKINYKNRLNVKMECESTENFREEIYNSEIDYSEPVRKITKDKLYEELTEIDYFIKKK